MTTAAWIACAAVLLIAAAMARGSFRSGVDLRHDDPTDATPPQPATADVVLFDVGGRRSLHGAPASPPHIAPSRARPRGPAATAATQAAVRGRPGRRSRTDAPCWICGGPRKPGCAHCQPKGPAA